MTYHELPKDILRANTVGEIKELLDLCKTGHLFEVQDWIKRGNPVNPPIPPLKGKKPKTPLQYGIERGFHSLVQVLLEAGAEIEYDRRYNTLLHALDLNRLDMIKLLHKHGADLKTVPMIRVFNTWEPEIMEYFIDAGADIRTGNPFASAFCKRIRTSLGVYRKYCVQNPDLQEQANIALRHHCSKGNLKWVSLMLWLGADPYKKGISIIDESYEEHPDAYVCAFELAIYARNVDVFKLKGMNLPKDHPMAKELLASSGHDYQILEHFLERGYEPNEQENGGSSLLNICLNALYRNKQHRSYRIYDYQHKAKIELLCQYGAKWIPSDAKQAKNVHCALATLSRHRLCELIGYFIHQKTIGEKDFLDLIDSKQIREVIGNRFRRFRERILEANRTTE